MLANDGSDDKIVLIWNVETVENLHRLAEAVSLFVDGLSAH